MSANDGQGLLGRRKNIEWPITLQFPSQVLLQNSMYKVSFALNELESTNYALADTQSSVGTMSPIWVAAPGIATVSMTGPVPQFQGCVDAVNDLIGQKSSANIRILAHKKYSSSSSASASASVSGTAIKTPFEECWNTCSQHLDNETDVGVNFGINPDTKTIKYLDFITTKGQTNCFKSIDTKTWKLTKGKEIEEGTSIDGYPSDIRKAIDKQMVTFFAIKLLPAKIMHVAVFVAFEPSDVAWIKITGCDTMKKKFQKMEHFQLLYKTIDDTFEDSWRECEEGTLYHGVPGTLNFPCTRNERDQMNVNSILIYPKMPMPKKLAGYFFGLVRLLLCSSIST